MKKKGNISIKAKLLGIIIPVVIAIILILVFTAYHVSSGIIESYSKNLLESSVNSQASKIEAWLEENLASMQMAKTMIEKLHPDETQLQTILDASCGYSENYPDGLFLAGSCTFSIFSVCSLFFSVPILLANIFPRTDQAFTAKPNQIFSVFF